MNDGHAPQLLDRGDVAMGLGSLQTLRMDKALVQLQRLPTALRHCRARGLEVFAGCRVHPAEEEMDAQELSRRVRGVLPCVALPASCSSAACQQGTGNG